MQPSTRLRRLGTLVPDVLGRVVGDPSALESGLVRPLGGGFHLPGPVDPTLTVGFPGLDLGVKVVSQEGLVFAVRLGAGRLQMMSIGSRLGKGRMDYSLGKPLTAPGVPFPAAPDVIRPRVTPIVPRPDPSSVQPPRTVVHGQTPLADDGPVGRGTQVLTRVAGRGEVFPPRSLVLGGRKDLVDVVVEGDLGGLRGVEDAVPIVAWQDVPRQPPA